MAIDKITYAAAKKYTDKSVAGGGAIKGKNCTIDSIEPITGGNRVTFKWTLDDGTVQTGIMDVMDGQDGQDGAQGPQGIQGPAGPKGDDGDPGLGIKSVDINEEDHLIITFDDDTTHDAGEISGGGGTGEVTSVNGKKGVVKLYATDIPMSNAVGAQTIALTIDQLQGSLANKVDAEAGKGLSSNDYTSLEKQKLNNLEPIYRIGSGLNLDSSTGELTATGAAVIIDDHLDDQSVNPVQNKVIAVPIAALQASMADKADKSELPTKLSELTNDEGFITKAVNDLTNYYLKSETYTQSQVNSLVAAVSTLDIEVVQTLPTTDISTTTIYLVPKSSAFSQNVYDEYICLDKTTTPATWEKIGDTEIDLSNYIQKSQTAGLVKNDGTIDTTQYQGVIADLATIRSGASAGATAYQKPNTGVPKTDLTSDVQTSLDKADTALQQHQDISGKADKVSGATNGDLAGLDTNGNIKDSGVKPSDFLVGSITPTPAATITDIALKTAINGAASSENKVVSAYAMKKWSNVLTKRYIVEGISDPSTSPIGTTGIGTWDDSATPDETDWLDIGDLTGIESSDDVDVSLKFDPASNEPITLGGYIIDTTTGKMCIKFGNTIATPANAKVAIDIAFMRNEFSTIS